MEDFLLGYLKDHWPRITIVLIVIIGLIYGAVRITMWATSWKHRIKNSEEECKKLNTDIAPRLSAIEHTISDVEGKIDMVENTVKGLVKSVDHLLIYLKGKDKKLDTTLFRSFSPIALTEQGEKLFSVLGGKMIIDMYKDDLFAEIEKQSIKTALDVQNYAPIAISNISEREGFNGAKNYIFTNPYYKYKNAEGEDQHLPLDIGTMCSVFGIYLRDEYLKAHPNIAPDPDTVTK